MPPQALNSWSPWMRALLATDDGGGDGSISPEQQAAATPAQPSTAAPPDHRIEDDRTAGTRGTTPQSPTTSGGPPPVGQPSAIQGSIDRGQVTNLSDRVPKPPNPLEARIAENKATMARLGTRQQPQTLGDTVLPGGGAGRGVGRFLINAVGGGVGQTRRDEAFKNTLAQRTALQQGTEADTRQLSQQQEAESRLREQEEMRQRLTEEGIAGRARNVDVQQAGATGRTQMQTDSRETVADQANQTKIDQFKTTDEYRRWKTRFDAENKLAIAKLHMAVSQNKAPAAMMQSAEFATGGLKMLDDAKAAMAELKASGVMGSLPANKVEDWIFGKGLVDPSLPLNIRNAIGKLRAASGYTASAAMRAHTGRSSQEIYNDFKQRLGPGQDWDALDGAMDETRELLTHYAMAASDASIAAIRAGTNVPPKSSNAPPRPPGVPASAVYDQQTRHWRMP